MKRRIASLITALALCLSLCPARAFAAGAEAYAGLCPHHEAHTDECGYDEESGSPCGYVCGICPVDGPDGELPGDALPYQDAQTGEQPWEIYEPYDAPDDDWQQQAELSPYADQEDPENEEEYIEVEVNGVIYQFPLSQAYILQRDLTSSTVFEVVTAYLIDTNDYSYTSTGSTALRVMEDGELYLFGKVTSKKGAGVEVKSGGSLSVSDTETVITGSTYGLDVASDVKKVQLFAGTFTGQKAAIRSADGVDGLEKLLGAGCAYFDASGNPLDIEDVGKATTVTVRFAPALEWAQDSVELDYTGSPVDKGDLPKVLINPKGLSNGQSDSDLSDKLQYSYRKQGDTEYTDGLPTNAGTYDVKVSLWETPSYLEISSKPITLKIKKISPIDTNPAAIKPVFNGTAQELVTAGTLKDVAARDNVVEIEFATSEDGPYTTEIPTGINAGNYTVWYRTAETENYNATGPTQVTDPKGEPDVEIRRKEITPIVTLSEYTYLYDGGEKQPKVTVKDVDNVTVLPDTEYQVEYEKNRNVGTATVIVKDQTGGNYAISEVKVNFKIISRTQEGLSIVGKPDTVAYGDDFTLSTVGGSGNGLVTWEVTEGKDYATVDKKSGRVKIKGVGSITIKATKSGEEGSGTDVTNNYEDAIDTWTFEADKRSVVATVTAEDKTYDGNVAAKVHAVVEQGVVPGDVITIDLAGTFSDANAGTDKTVTVNKGSISISGSISGTNSEVVKVSDYYDVSFSSTTVKASINKATAKIKTEPTSANPTYDGNEKDLLSKNGVEVVPEDEKIVLGEDEVLELEYALSKNGPYSETIPTGINAGDYTVWYRTVETENFKATDPVQVPVKIARKGITPKVTLSETTYLYDGGEKRPEVTVEYVDDKGNVTVLPDTEYQVKYENNQNVGTATVKVSDKDGGNYAITEVSADFEITLKAQESLSIVTDKPTNVYYGDTFRLSAMGGSGSGAVQWSSTPESIATIDSNGLVTVVGTGSFTIKAYREGKDGYGKSNEAIVNFYANPKPVVATVTAEDKNYDGNTAAKVHAVVEQGVLPGDVITISGLTGTFSDANAGTGKTVTVSIPDTISISVINSEGVDVSKYYDVSFSSTPVKASIFKVDAKLADTPKAKPLTYDTTSQDLVDGGTTVNNIGDLEYSLDQYGEYSTAIPKGTNAGEYTVWYRVADSVNYTGISPTEIKVTIEKADPKPKLTASDITYGQSLSESTLTGGEGNVSGSFAWKDGTIKPGIGKSEHDVIFTPNDTDNYKTVTIKVAVTVTPVTDTDNNNTGSTGTGGTPGTGAPDIPYTPGIQDIPYTPYVPNTPNAVSAPMQTSVQNGTASTVLSAAEGSRLVREAVSNQSDNVVIKPDVTGSVTRAEVSIPAQTVSQLRSETNAALTVSTPVADVTIPNAALGMLSSAGSAVDVVAERRNQAVVLTLAAGGKTVESVPGGLTLTVPVENAGPGTVAVLVHRDGTRETIRKSVAADGSMSIPLAGSATVEIVDNSKRFSDVPAASWAADAVAFASAHELFNGTSETEFSPEQAMSRGMLATVLYNLEGRPAQAPASGFRDVSAGDWYAQGVAWAAANGIAGGYGDGQFGPNDSITREQFAVMLWKYAGSPQAGAKGLNFSDAGQVSGYALDALRWATEKGILNGYGNGQLDPGGKTTRAQAAQMLKNFMENT